MTALSQIQATLTVAKGLNVSSHQVLELGGIQTPDSSDWNLVHRFPSLCNCYTYTVTGVTNVNFIYPASTKKWEPSSVSWRRASRFKKYSSPLPCHPSQPPSQSHVSPRTVTMGVHKKQWPGFAFTCSRLSRFSLFTPFTRKLFIPQFPSSSPLHEQWHPSLVDQWRYNCAFILHL